eukprot:TRINITY_DN2076_c0_g1_i3.p1 TRINITY_DN2076_c0_g1~~TRINITY_DN2076_c0_g1_i3.p1  ORF type:complete len:485 (+),score=107.19 TRINITY_DN2076_c0_g1_i3:183-1637(+)
MEDRFVIKIGMIQGGIDTVGKMQLQKLSELTANQIEIEGILPEATIQFDMIDESDMYDGEYKYVLYNSSNQVPVMNAASELWGQTVHMRNLAGRPEDVAIALQILFKEFGWNSASINFCAHDLCKSLSDSFMEVTAMSGVEILSTSTFSSYFSLEEKKAQIEKALVDRTRILVVSGGAKYMQGILLALADYKSRNGFMPQLVLAMYDCKDLLVANDECDEVCVGTVAEYAVGQLCLGKDSSADSVQRTQIGREWLDEFWNPNVGSDALSTSEMILSGLASWGDDNMAEEVPIAYDFMRWIGKSAGDTCHNKAINFLAIGDAYSNFMKNCYSEIFSSRESIDAMLSTDFQGLFLNSAPDSILIPINVFGLDTTRSPLSFRTIGVAEHNNEVLSNSTLHSYHWPDGSLTPPTSVKIEDWPINRQVHFLLMFSGLLLILAVGVWTIFTKVPRRVLRLGLMNKYDCMALCGFVSTLAIIRLGAMYMPA